jgi:hypothetical protein
MSIKGKFEGISRVIGNIIILLGIVLEIFLSLTILNNLLLSLALILMTVPALIFSILLKLEKDFIVKNATKLLLLLLLEILVSIVLLEIYSQVFIKFYLFPCSILLLITCWHTSLSLHMNKKIIFLISSIGYFLASSPTWVSNITPRDFFFANLYLKLTVLLGIFLIIFAEIIMVKKGWLNYI